MRQPTRLPDYRTLLLLALLTFPCTSGRAQPARNADPEALQTALVRAYEKANLMVALSAQEWRPGLAISATRLDAGETITVALNLSRRHNYTFLAAAASAMTDVDLYLRDSLGNVLFSDREDDGTPIIEFRVPRTGNYRLQLHVSAADAPTNHVAIALLRSAGKPIIEGDFRRQTDQFFTAAARLSNQKDAPQFTTSPGHWPVQGYLIAPEHGVTMTNIRSNTEKLTLAATAGLEAHEITLYLANDQQEIVTQTRGKSPFPLLSFPPDAERRYDLRIESPGRRSAGLVLIGTFQ